MDFRRIFSDFHQLLVGLWPGEELEGSDASEDSERVLSSEFGDVSSPDPTDQTDKTPAPTMSYTETIVSTKLFQLLPNTARNIFCGLVCALSAFKCYIMVHRWFAMFSIPFLFLFDFRPGVRFFNGEFTESLRPSRKWIRWNCAFRSARCETSQGDINLWRIWQHLATLVLTCILGQETIPNQYRISTSTKTVSRQLRFLLMASSLQIQSSRRSTAKYGEI